MSSFRFDAGNLLEGFASLENKTKAAVNLYGDTVAKKMENHAKTNYKWTDRTFQASRRLKGVSLRTGSQVVRCEISHGVDYGIWLEVCNEGKYAVLKDTVDTIGPQALKGLSNLLK